MHPLDYLARLDGVAQAGLVARGELRAEDLVAACERRHAFVNSAHALALRVVAGGRAKSEQLAAPS